MKVRGWWGGRRKEEGGGTWVQAYRNRVLEPLIDSSLCANPNLPDEQVQMKEKHPFITLYAFELRLRSSYFLLRRRMVSSLFFNSL